MTPRGTKVVVITGASAGIGAAIALAAARRWGKGAKLVLGARRADRLEAVAAQCRTLEAEAVAVVADVAKREDVMGLVRTAVEKFGRIDAMIANAGYGFLAKVEEATEEQFDQIVATNVKGTWYAMQAAAGVMRKQEALGNGRDRRGQIVVMSSGAARRGLPLYGIYAMTKAAQLSLAEAMRVELKGDGIYVSTVHPLSTETEFFEVASAKSRIKSKGLGRTQSAEVVGRKVVGLLERPRPELWPAPLSRWMLTMAVMFPRLADWSMGRMVRGRTK